jgi:hypothetical protein
MEEKLTHEEQLAAMRQEMQQWAFGIRSVYVLLLALPLYYITRILVELPQVGQIFEDMLGSKQKLPATTLLLLDHPLAAGSVIWLGTILAAAAIFMLQSAKQVWVVKVISVIFLIASAHVVTALLMEPLMQVVMNLSGGGG